MENFTDLNSSIPEVEASDELITDELETDDLEQISAGGIPLAIGIGVGVVGVAVVGTFAAGAAVGYMEGETEEADRCHGR